MSLRDLTDPAAVLLAVEAYDRLGKEIFLKTYGYKQARSYFLIHQGKSYDSKAIVGVAHGIQHDQILKSSDFSGGENTVRRQLEKLGFTVISNLDNPTGDTNLGHIANFPVGSTFKNRVELSKSGVHRPNQAGICGTHKEGATSVVVSGKYEDDRDDGNEIIYTGHGGRHSSTGRQVSDQDLIRQGQPSTSKEFPNRTQVKIVIAN